MDTPNRPRVKSYGSRRSVTGTPLRPFRRQTPSAAVCALVDAGRERTDPLSLTLANTPGATFSASELSAALAIAAQSPAPPTAVDEVEVKVSASTFGATLCRCRHKPIAKSEGFVGKGITRTHIQVIRNAPTQVTTASTCPCPFGSALYRWWVGAPCVHPPSRRLGPFSFPWPLTPRPAQPRCCRASWAHLSCRPVGPPCCVGVAW